MMPMNNPRNMKAHLRRVAAASITDEDVRRDPEGAFHIALETARASLRVRAALKDQPND